MVATAVGNLPPNGDSTKTESEKAVHDEKDAVQAPVTDKRELKEEDCLDELPYAWPSWRKWWVLTVIFLVQTSMNFNTSLYSNGLGGISKQFNVSEQGARAGAAIFLVLYAFGCELWAPWSEEIGRKPIMQASLALVNLWTLPVALAPNFASLMVGRALGGLSSAGGSVTLGMIADMFDSDHQQYAVAYIVFSSVGGSILGPIVGGFVEAFLPWQWCIWIQLIFGGFVQILHLLTVPETRTSICLNRIAKKRRKNGDHVYGPDEIESFWERFTWRETLWTWYRPFRMFVTEPIVATLSLLSGFSDALIFMQIQSFSLVYTQWGFNAWQDGLAFIPIGIGYVIAWLSFIPAIKRNMRQRAARPNSEHAQYESRLEWLLITAPCLPIGLLIFALTCNGPPVHWIGSMFASMIIGIANYSIYMATIDYMVCAYGPYSASATGGNGWARDFLAGVLTVPATPFYTNIRGSNNKPLQNASFILFAISCLLVMFVYIIYWKGPVLRKRSPFAESLAKGEDTERHHAQRRPSTAGGPGAASAPTTTSTAAEKRQSDAGITTPRAQRPHFGPGSRRSSYDAAKVASRNASRNASRAHSLDEERDGDIDPYTAGASSPGGKGEHVPHHELDSRLRKMEKIPSERQ